MKRIKSFIDKAFCDIKVIPSTVIIKYNGFITKSSACNNIKTIIHNDKVRIFVLITQSIGYCHKFFGSLQEYNSDGIKYYNNFDVNI